MRRLINVAAILAALYDSKLLVWDIAGEDFRRGQGSVLMVAIAVVVSAAFLALPVFGLRAASNTAGLVMGLASLALSAGGFVILSAAFTP
jgi:hypothetical protein